PVKRRLGENVVDVTAVHKIQIQGERLNQRETVEADSPYHRHVEDTDAGADRGAAIPEYIPGKSGARRKITIPVADNAGRQAVVAGIQQSHRSVGEEGRLHSGLKGR